MGSVAAQTFYIAEQHRKDKNGVDIVKSFINDCIQLKQKKLVEK